VIGQNNVRHQHSYYFNRKAPERKPELRVNIDYLTNTVTYEYTSGTRGATVDYRISFLVTVTISDASAKSKKLILFFL